jgi:ABC-2 type transport system permease protein
MPVLILVMNGIAFDTAQVLPGTGGRTVFEIYVLPVALVLVVATVGVVNMPSFLAAYRRTGILRRLAVTPASPAMVLVAQAVVGAAQVAVGVAIALGFAFWQFGAQGPARLWTTVGVFALAVTAMYAVGMLVAAVAPTPQSAVAIGLVAFFAMGATGGMFGPRENLPDAVADVGGVLPFGASVHALAAAWSGLPAPGSVLAGLAVSTLVAGAGAALMFRWE